MNDSAILESESKSNIAHSLSGKYLTFVLGHEEYGVDIVKAREIIKLMEITTVPKMPDYIKGVINLRGKVIPVIDLRMKFGMEPSEYTKETCIIVVDVGSMMMGVVVDTVSEVIDITEEEIEPPPKFGKGIDTQFILGMGKIKGSVKILLDIKAVLSRGDIELAENLSDGGSEN